MQRPALLQTLAGPGTLNGRCLFAGKPRAEDVALKSDVRGLTRLINRRRWPVRLTDKHRPPQGSLGRKASGRLQDSSPTARTRPPAISPWKRKCNSDIYLAV